MNGYSTGRPYDYGPANPGKPMADGYRRDGPNGFEKDALRLNPPSSNLAHRTGRIDLRDAIQVHLLTETALSDSKHYEILTQEEVDELKKQSQLLSQRVEATRTNLAIQSKYRDAAVSMARLYGPAQPDDPNTIEAERERQACQRKCDELAAELFNLEKRLMAPQRRLLEHTAGILQLTHKASKKKPPPQLGQLINGIPGSPESLYTYSLGRDSLDPAADDNYLDDPSLYQLESPDGIHATRQLKKNAIEIPMKSPIREQMRTEMDRVREENMQLRGQTDLLIKKLQSLNVSLRETIVRFNPDVNSDYLEPPTVTTTTQDAKPAELLKSQVEYLESGLVAVQAEQESFAGGKEIGERVGSLNLQVRDLLTSADPKYAPTPMPSESDVQGQLTYLENSLRVADSHLGRALSRAQDDETGQVLARLWDSIQNGFAEAKKRREERRKTRMGKGLTDEDGMSDDEAFDMAEPYSLAAFSSRVQWLHTQASTLKDQKSVLKRQIRQQRELNNKSDAQKDEELSQKQQELEQSRQMQARAENDAKDAQKMLSDALRDLEGARDSAGSNQAAQAELRERDAKIEALEATLKAVENSLAAAESERRNAGQKLADMDRQLASLTQQKAAAEEKAEGLGKELGEKTASLSDKEKAIKAREGEVEQLNMTLVELKTEVTIARAELDGAYGSRAERAADVAAIKNSAEVAKLRGQVEKLKEELSGTVQELESITKETIGAEREWMELESKLDEALSAKAALEADVAKSTDQVSKLQEELDGARLKAAAGQGSGGRPGTGASMLSEQFRTTMREERKRFQEDLREERAKCRKLEDELNRLKRSQGPGKSPLSPP